MKEKGRIGQKRLDGHFYEEFLPELSGTRGIRVYREMEQNDDTIGAIMFALKMLIRQVKWHVEPGGDSVKDREAAEFVETCMGDMQSTWTDTISEILSFLPYGWSFHEIVYKRRMGKKTDRKSAGALPSVRQCVGAVFLSGGQVMPRAIGWSRDFPLKQRRETADRTASAQTARAFRRRGG